MGKPKGFAVTAARDPEAHRELARRGGKAAHAAGTAHEFTSEEAREAGRKGGRATADRKRKRSEEAGSAQQAGATSDQTVHGVMWSASGLPIWIEGLERGLDHALAGETLDFVDGRVTKRETKS